MIDTDQKKIEELLTRGVEEVIDKKHLEEKLLSGKELRIKLGIDPTSSNIHIGRAIPLLKLRDFQELGHKIVFIIGDFTGVIGDTSDKESERPMLTREMVKKNMESYVEQAKKIIDIDKTEIHYNSEWLGKLDYEEIGKQADIFSINDFISRENIKKRLDEGKRVSLREVLYPLMQGYDSVAVKADVEIGGTDQRFNLLAGRDIQKYYGQPPQDILTNPLIEGLDGRKMSSSWGNTINLFDESNDMFGKVMSLKDELILRYFEFVTRIPMTEIEKYKKDLENGANPRDLKIKLAFEIVKMFHSAEAAQIAQDNFVKTFSDRQTPEDIPLINLGKNEASAFEIVRSCFGQEEKSNSEIRRLFLQNAIDISDEVISDLDKTIIIPESGAIVKVGKRTWFKVTR